MALQINTEVARKLVRRLNGDLKQAKAMKKPLEEQMIKDLRQYRAVYDPEIQQRLDAMGNRAKGYPRDTRVKVTGFLSKMMELMFPASGDNFLIEPTAVPSIQENDINQIISVLEQQAQESGTPVTSESIENAIIKFAKDRAENMKDECKDQLQNSDVPFPELAKRTMRSGAVYSFGVTKGPMVEFKEERTWERGVGGRWKAVKKNKAYPVYANISSWNIFMDMPATNWVDQSAIFERLPFTRFRLEELVGRPGFEDEAIKKFLRDNREGNYTPSEQESELDVLNHNENTSGAKKQKLYEIYSFRGFISAHELMGLGVEVDEEDQHKQRLVEIWFMGEDTLVKLDHTPFGDKPSDFYHPYIHGADEDTGLAGVSLPQDVRNSQMGICATSRQLQDNAAAVAGPIFEVNRDLIDKGKDIGAIHAFKVIYRNGMGNEATTQAVRQLNTDSHITELLSLLQAHRDAMDIESSMPAWLFGAAQPLGEAFRTTSNMSAMQGGATMVFKDHVRSFDNYVRSVVSSLIKWNLEFNDKEEIKGDFNVLPAGNASLVARELRGAALDQFWLSLQPAERAMFDQYRIMKARLEARDLPGEFLKPRTEAEAAMRQAEEAAAQAAQMAGAVEQAKGQKLSAEAEQIRHDMKLKEAKLPVEVKEALARAEQALASAQATGDAQKLKSAELMLKEIPSILQQAGGGGQEGGQPAAGLPEEAEPQAV